MGGRSFVPLSGDNREAAGVAAGDEVEIELDSAPREISVPADLSAALARDGTARAFFEELSYTHRRSGCVGSRRPRKPTHARHGLPGRSNPYAQASEHVDQGQRVHTRDQDHPARCNGFENRPFSAPQSEEIAPHPELDRFKVYDLCSIAHR